MIYTIKNGLFKHTLKTSARKLVAVKLFTNGWNITDAFGNTFDSVLLDDTIHSDRWSAEMLHHEEQTLLRPPMVSELVLTTEYGVFHLKQMQSRDFCFTTDEGDFKVEGLLSRNTTLNLPNCFTDLDAITLFCYLQIAVHDDDVELV